MAKSVRDQEIEIIGGFYHRCFDEICMMLEAAEIPYHLNSELIYALPESLQNDRTLSS